MFELVFRVESRTKPVIHFWRGISRPSGRSECGCQKRQKRTAAK